MAKMNRISATPQPSDYLNHDSEEGTRLCYMPFKKKNNHDKIKTNTISEKVLGKRSSELVAGSFLSLSLAIAKMGGINVYNVSLDNLS